MSTKKHSRKRPADPTPLASQSPPKQFREETKADIYRSIKDLESELDSFLSAVNSNSRFPTFDVDSCTAELQRLEDCYDSNVEQYLVKLSEQECLVVLEQPRNSEKRLANTLREERSLRLKQVRYNRRTKVTLLQCFIRRMTLGSSLSAVEMERLTCVASKLFRECSELDKKRIRVAFDEFVQITGNDAARTKGLYNKLTDMPHTKRTALVLNETSLKDQHTLGCEMFTDESLAGSVQDEIVQVELLKDKELMGAAEAQQRSRRELDGIRDELKNLGLKIA
jgi:hypothetical protein